MTEVATTPETVALTDISVLDGVSLRPLDQDTLATYNALPASVFPPIDIYGDGGILGDGFHRVQSAEMRGDTTIEAIRHEGGLDEAKVCAATANNAHGKPLTRPERNEAIKRLLELTDWTHPNIGLATGASSSTVDNIANGIKVKAKHPDLTLPDTKAYRVATVKDDDEQRAVAEYAADPDVTEPDVRVVTKAVNEGTSAKQAIASRSVVTPKPKTVNPVKKMDEITSDVSNVNATLETLVALLEANPEAKDAVFNTTFSPEFDRLVRNAGDLAGWRK